VRERELVQLLVSKDQCVDAIRALVGGVTATELRRVQLSDAAVDALTEGVDDPNPRIRWWCVQLLDHVPDRRAVDAIARALNDPVPRVRRNAAHALGCAACKPNRDGALPADAVERLTDMAAGDENAKVRAQARSALACRGVG
jgi:HEAT repeat protein